MVFEKALSSVLNTFLGDFIENLDGNQLNVGIWGGDVQLKNLVIKPSALDELDLPVQTAYGTIGNLVLKIPWKSLYTSPTVILVEDIYLLAAPNLQVKYDPLKEEKKFIELKKKEIQKVENAKKAEAEKDKPKADATFVEKLITNIVKNVQLHIKNIHIRYEDKVTNPSVPFALGITLRELNVESTDSNWKKAIVEDISKIYKIVQLEGLSVYWNCNSKMYGDLPHVDMIYRMQKDIASKSDKPEHYTYILGPINASSRLRLNQKPENDTPAYSIPKLLVNLNMEKLFIGISKAQYRDLIALADSMGRMAKGVPYRKYRPQVSGYRGHYREWWHFAYQCILENEVRRRKRNWDWGNILQYRNMCKEYKDLYKKQIRKATNVDEKQRIDECEKVLDLTNIVIIRQKIELETERLSVIESAEKKTWFGWMWGGSSKDDLDKMKKTTAILQQFESEMTPAEKARLYKAIDYQENVGPAVYPEAFIDNSITFLLKTLEVELRDDDSKNKKVLVTDLQGVKCKLETRPVTSALSVHVKIDDLETVGLKLDGLLPKIVTSDNIQKDLGLLEVTFETNPLDGSCDQRIHVVAQPLTIIYDAETVNKILDIFKMPPDTSLDQIQAAAGSSLSNVKEMTSTGLQYAIEKHVRLDINIDLHAPYLIVPHAGKYTGSENVLVVNFGRLKLFSFGKRSTSADVRKLYDEGIDQRDILKLMIDHSYDRFKLELTDIQILCAHHDEDWKQCIRESTVSDMHLLNPISLSVTYSKCLIVDDPRLPLSKVNGELPYININVSNARLLLLLALGISIPLPASDVTDLQPLSKNKSSSMMLLKYKELQESAKQTKNLLTSLPTDTSKKELVQFTTMQAQFVMNELSVTINQQESITSSTSELISLKVKSLECELKQQTYNTNISLVLGSINLQQKRESQVINIITTPISSSGDDYHLFKVGFTQVDKKSPELHSLYKSCETSLNLDFGVLGIILHQEGLLTLIHFVKIIQDEYVRLTEELQIDRIATSGPPRKLSVIGEATESHTQKKAILKTVKKKKIPLVVETVKFRLRADLQDVTVKFSTDRSDISSCSVRGINSEIIVKDTYTQVNAKLQEISVVDLNPLTLHNLILSGTGGTALTTQIVLNNIETESEKPDIDVTVKMGGIRIIFLNWFVTNMLNFLNQFQAAQQKIIEASQAAAQSAKENMKDVYAKATKISLNIYLKAPDIFVPVNSQSYNALHLDLGVISLSNRFLTLEVKNEDGFSAVVDELKVNLNELKIARIRLDNQNQIIKECLLLEPLNVNIIIKRNLTTSWYTYIPDIDISGKIKMIKLLLSQADYQMIMSTLSGNLAEGQQSSPTEIGPAKSTVIKDNITIANIESAVLTAPDIVKGNEELKVHTFLKFTFSMEELIVNLYTGGSKTLTEDTMCHDLNSHLGRFSLEGLSLKGRILTDQSITTSVLLVNCLLDDMRKGREDKLNRLIERSQNDLELPGNISTSSESVAPPRSMIDITFQQKGNDMFADVRIYSFTIIISMEYLLKLADFLQNPEQPQQQHIQTQTKSVTSVTSKSKTLTAKTTVSAAPTKPQKEAHLTINLKLEKPDIVLVEHMDNINTNALILNSEILVKLRLAGTHQVINGVIKDLQLYTCNYNPVHRVETRSNVLYPVNISLAGSTPQDKGLHVELLVTNIRLSVSPTTIELLNRVLATMSSGGVKQDKESEEPFNYSDIWDQKPYIDPDYWFLKTDFALEALESEPVAEERKITAPPLQELCIISMPSIMLIIEAGIGNKTLPMLMLEMSLKGSARNWSTQLSMESSLTMEMGYYNSRLALWEPLIEPVESVKDCKSHFIPWELKLEVSMNEQEDIPVAISPISDTDGDTQVQPVMSIDVTSEYTLELTVTKTCLEVLQNLGKAFASAMSADKIKTSSTIEASYKILNEIGEDVTLLLEQSSFIIAEGGSLEDINKSAAVPLQLKPDLVTNETLQLGKELIAHSQKKDHCLQVKINDKNCELTLPVVRADKRFFLLNYRGLNQDNWGLISEIKVEEGVTIITLRSILQVYNHFNVAIDVYYMTAKGNELELIGVVQPGGCINIPLKAVYTPTNELFFAISGYAVTSSPYIWKDLQTNLSITKLLHCPQKDVEKGKEPFVIKAIGELEQVYFENTLRHTMASSCYNIHLRPVVILKNCLPFDVVCCVDEQAEEFDLKAGDTLQLPNVDPGKNVVVIRIPDYLEKEWSCRQEIYEEPSEFSVWTFNSYDSPTKMSLDLGMHTLNKNGSLLMSLYCPFWMLNKTGLMIGYRSSDENLNVLHHPANFKGPVLFSFNAKNFFGKKKASIRVESGEWSDKFSLDVAGSSGVITCKANEKIYQIGVHNQLTYNGLTKQVTFMPYYVIINNAPFPIECQENVRAADPWIIVERNSCTALWPKSELEDKLLRIRIVGTEEVSAPFLYTESHTTLLKLDNKYGGISVDIQLTEGAVYINLVPYENGSAPALLINHSSVVISYWEKDSVQKRSLLPKHSVLYTWENPSGPRMLVWDKGNKKEILNDLRKDDYGEYSLSDQHNIYWTSFLDGMQRVLLFTEEDAIAEGAQATNLLEVAQQEITVSIHGLGLSLVNNINRQEVMYIGIASSGVIWETCKMSGKRFKPLGNKESTHIEAAFQQYLVKIHDDLEEGALDRIIIDGKTEVDFKHDLMLKPSKRRIRRTFQTGLWLQMKNSPSQMQLHAKINRLQIDNQMYDCTFPVVLAPVPPPKSVAADSGIKPFVEVSIVQLLMKNSQIRQFKYFKVLVQEFHIKVDLGFINAIFELLQQSESSDEEEKKLFLADMKLVDEPLYFHASTQSIQEQKSFYDLLHFSPLKIHISFSMATGISASGQNVATPNFLNILLQGIGVTLTDLQDVVFKLAYFERNYTFLTQKQLISEATSHYVGQSVKQLYVLVLGLDVIGNPYGLVLGITKGVEDLFYEPFQGAIQGPGEFAEGLALGVKSLFGHTVGGAAGAMSRITGAMGKGIAALTFDDEYQRKRRDQLNKTPSSAQEGIARSGKGLVMGVYSGVTGVFTKPVAGAKEQGVEGFFKGLGKGAVGLVTRPVAGVVDFASGSLDVVKRAAECGEETLRLRSPRFLQADGLVRPYNKLEAEGHKLLTELSKGKYASTDIYVSHYVVIEKKEILLLTDKRMAYICRNDIFGGWQMEWSYTWEELPQAPRVVPKGILITTSEKKKKLFGSSDTTKTILIGSPSIKEEICTQIESLRGA